jgi:hypothetical protein
MSSVKRMWNTLIEYQKVSSLSKSSEKNTIPGKKLNNLCFMGIFYNVFYFLQYITFSKYKISALIL